MGHMNENLPGPSITAIDGPGKFSFMWPILQEGGSVETSVAYELARKGPETFVHVVHRAPKPLAGSWTDFWNAALQSLQAFLESSAAVSEEIRTPPTGKAKRAESIPLLRGLKMD